MPQKPRKEQQDAEDEEFNQDVADEDNENDDGNKGPKVEAISALRDFKYNLLVTLQDPARGLEVRPLNLVYDESTIYGQRNAFHEGWLITSTQAPTLTRNTIFKRLVIDKVPMLPRSVACSGSVRLCWGVDLHGFVTVLHVMCICVTEEMVKVEVGRKVCADTDRLSWAQARTVSVFTLIC